MKLARINLVVGICAAVFDPREGDEVAAEIRPRHFDLQVDFVRPQRHKYNQGGRGREAFYPRRTLRGVLEAKEPVIGRSDKPAVAFYPSKVQSFI